MASQDSQAKTLDAGGKNIVALMAALLVAIFAFQLNASMLSPALVAMQNELHTTAVEIGNAQTVFFTATALFSLFLPRLADIVGRKKVLSGMLAVTGIGCIVSAAAQDTSVVALVVISVVLGISYAGMGNIMLNGLGIVLSPKDNPGYLPGMNAGAFNLGAGLSFAVLYAAMDAYAAQAGAAGGYSAAMVMGAILLIAALACSFLIPKPEDADQS